MKDKIKEILYDLGNKDSYINDETILTFDEAKDILDYITNLQEENRMLKQNVKDTYDTSQELLFELQERIDKAIEHIKQHQLIFKNQYEELSGFDNHLLDILNGDDE